MISSSPWNRVFTELQSIPYGGDQLPCCMITPLFYPVGFFSLINSIKGKGSRAKPYNMGCWTCLDVHFDLYAIEFHFPRKKLVVIFCFFFPTFVFVFISSLNVLCLEFFLLQFIASDLAGSGSIVLYFNLQGKLCSKCLSESFIIPFKGCKLLCPLFVV